MGLLHSVAFLCSCTTLKDCNYIFPAFILQVLTKSYKMKCEPDEDDPFSFEGPEIISTSGYLSLTINYMNQKFLRIGSSLVRTLSAVLCLVRSHSTPAGRVYMRSYEVLDSIWVAPGS